MVIDFNSLLQTAFWNNTGRDYLIALGLFFLSLLILKLFKTYLLHLLKKFAQKTKTDIDDYVVEFIEQIHWPFYIIVSLFIAAKALVLPELVNKIFNYLMIIILVYYAVKGSQKTVDYITKKQIAKRLKIDKKEDTTLIQVLSKFVKAFLWIVALLLLLSNLGVNITSLIAGLGIGGLAIAFALQNILSDLFASFTIYFDKPFKKGDFIIIGQDMGVIEHIGLKSTRIRALQGQEIIVSNRELTNIRVHNYKMMKKRRIAFAFGVEYGTSVTKLKKINSIVEKVIKKIKLADLDRVHFKEFGDFSLNYEVVYYLNTADYNKYMDTQQEINLGIKKEFERAGIEMAFPTQTIYLKKGG